uniref:Growth factor receptor domain-containing protein n=1 Tax=Echeneis naucrates TaxID=173247 RepID=A0A665V2H6_ECHNA
MVWNDPERPSNKIFALPGPCNPECSDDGCEGPSPQQCVTCLHFFLKFKNNTRLAWPQSAHSESSELLVLSSIDRRRCKRCYYSCESCTGSRSDQCTSCQPGHYLTEGTNTCTAVCGDEHYLDHGWISGFKPCHKACATCAGAGVEACNHCAEGYLMEEWKCVSSCSPGFYATQPNPEIADGHRVCRRCDASCLTCAGPSLGNCSSCSSGHSLEEGVCVVNTACTDGQSAIFFLFFTDKYNSVGFV